MYFYSYLYFYFSTFVYFCFSAFNLSLFLFPVCFCPSLSYLLYYRSAQHVAGGEWTVATVPAKIIPLFYSTFFIPLFVQILFFYLQLIALSFSNLFLSLTFQTSLLSICATRGRWGMDCGNRSCKDHSTPLSNILYPFYHFTIFADIFFSLYYFHC